jgi:peptidoglycan hydrolase-like protein with peptidoglycan-binding domain
LNIVQKTASNSAMKRIAVLFLVTLATALLARADEQVRAVQNALKEQGFYYGEVDGDSGAETTAAIRRYQIRNGLEVTGTLTAEMLGSLNMGAQKAAPPTAERRSAPPDTSDLRGPNVSESDKKFLERENRKQAREGIVQPPAPLEPLPSAAGFAELYARTPYERAPREVQEQTLVRAQKKLARDGFYRGQIDGDPGPETERALMDYQADKGLPRTGRLDMETLARMDLLPVVRRIVPRPDYVEPRPPPGRRVYRGIWVQ